MAKRWAGVEHLVGIDIETTGALVGKHAIMAVGVAVVHVPTQRIVATKRWASDVGDAQWEERCIEEFWSKHTDALRELQTTGPFFTQTQLGIEVARWFKEAHALYPSFVIVSDFPLFDIGWLHHAMALSRELPLYLGPGNAWQNILDIDAYEEALAHAGVDTNVDVSDLVKPTHIPEVDATYMTMRFVRILHAAGFVGHV